MEELPAVSIFIVTYLDSEERCEILRHTCESALAQQYPDFEVVVSDNGGACSAHDALSSIGDQRLRIFRHSDNVGFTGNINRCLDLCKHDIIKPICDDDLIHPGFLAQTVAFVNDDTLVMTNIKKYPVGSIPEDFAKPAGSGFETVTRGAGYGKDVWTLPYAFLPSAMLYTRKLFETLGGFDPNTVTSDWDFFIEACLHRRVVHVKQTLCYVGVWGGSLTEQMVVKPFFFPYESLYTKFRVYHCKPLSKRDRRALLFMLCKECFVEGLRPIKHFTSANYHKGYREYVRRFLQLLRMPRQGFGPRPCKTPIYPS